MYSHFITYYHIAKLVERDFKDMYVSKIFSTSKTELIIEFRNSNIIKQIVLQLVQSEIVIYWDVALRNDGKRCLKWFDLIDNSCLEKVETNPWERSLSLKFTNKQEILILGYGKFGKVIAKQKGGNIAAFLSDKVEQLPEKRTFKVEKLITANEKLPSMLLFLPTYFPSIYLELLKASTLTEQTAILLNYIDLFYTLYPKLSNNNEFEFTFEEPNNFILDAYRWSIDYLKEIELAKKKQLVQQQLTSLKQNLKQTIHQQTIFNTKPSFRKLGDLLLSNYTEVEKQWLNKLNFVKVMDFDFEVLIDIPVKKELSIEENATKFYKREKNRHLEAKEFDKKIDLLNTKISNLTKLEIEEKYLLKTEINNTNKQSISLPYKIVFFKDIEIWIGKSAIDNDKMLKIVRKTDIWLHARNQAGSHVIIRTSKADLNNELLLFAGKLAVQNSKAKTQKLVPVIYTERKYISKGKKLPPGAVHVMQENVIDIINE